MYTIVSTGVTSVVLFDRLRRQYWRAWRGGPTHPSGRLSVSPATLYLLKRYFSHTFVVYTIFF